MGNLLWSSDRPEFCERVAKLSGGTTYRTPNDGGRRTDDNQPEAHAVAMALSYSRQGAQDIGPDVAYCLVLKCDSYRKKVVRLLAEALGNNMDGREIRHARPYAYAAAEAAWDAVIHERRDATRRRPPACPTVAWEKMLLAGLATIHDSAWTSLAIAERRFHES